MRYFKKQTYKGNNKAFGIILPDLNSGLYSNQSPKAPTRKAPTRKARPTRMNDNKKMNSKISNRKDMIDEWENCTSANFDSTSKPHFDKK